MQQQSTEKKIRANLKENEKAYKELKKIEMDNYGGSFTKQIEALDNSTKLMDDSFNTFNRESTKMGLGPLVQSFAEIQTELKNWISSRSYLSDSIIERKKKDFLEGGFFNEKRGEKFCSIVSANLPASHVKAVEELKNLQNKIVDERKLGNFPMKDIDEHEKLLRKAHNELSTFVYSKMDRNYESTKKIKRSLVEFEKFTSFSTFHIEGSSKSTDESKQNLVARSLGTEKDQITRLPKGLGFETLRSLPSNQAPGPSNFAIGGFTLFALAATWYLMRQNAKTKEKPVEEKFNTEELKKISPLFGNENIKIENQNVHFNDFQEELVENIKRFFKDYKNIKTTENDKGLTLNFKNLSAREGKEVFSKFLKEFKDDLNKLAELSQQKRIEEELQIKRNQNEQKKINDLNNSKNIIRTSFDKIEEIKNTNGNESKKNKDIDEQTKKIRANLKILDGETLDSKYITILLENSQKLSTLTKDSIDTTAHQAREAKYGVNPRDPSTNPVTPNATATATATVTNKRSPG